jgi:ubiquitin C-terminal hydrolase
MQSSYAQTIACRCGHKSTTYGTEAKLTVYLAPILKNGTLQRYLQRSFIDRVEYRCDSCGTTKERPKIRKFISTGDVVCVHISRVGPDYRKITANASIPLLLDLSKLVDEGNTESQVYELRSVVKHSGSANSGHYVACTVDPTSRSGGWQFFNDWSDVRKHGDENFALGTAMGSPFLCFFQRVRKE